MSQPHRAPASIPATPPNEGERLETLYRLDILDTAPEPAFDQLAALARQLTRAPHAMVSFIDERRQWYKAKSGSDLDEIPREDAFCSHAILVNEPTIVADTLDDERFCEHPLVIGPPHVRFYAGFPVRIDGNALGTLCVLGPEPHELSDQECEGLAALRDQVEAQLNLREALRESERLRRETIEQAQQLELTHKRLAQVDKTQALGRMAGGIAHDFNNILTIIRTCADFLLRELQPDAHLREDADDIVAATIRASALTRQLLAFGRAQALDPRVVALDEIVAPMQKLLRRVVPEEIDLHTRLDAADAYLHVDPSQLEQVVVNLVLNARDAVQPGGQIAIETTRARLADGEHERIPAGEYGVVRVRDNGIGIDADVVDQIFDPFFSAGEHSSGNGLGLAIVQGVVSQSDGYIDVDAGLDAGVQFEIWLPTTQRDDPAEAKHKTDTAPRSSSATVLLVEDDRLVRKSLRRILRSRDHEVLEAEDAAEAMQLWSVHQDSIDAVVSDVVLPGRRGPDIVADLRRERASLPALFVTGYTGKSDIDVCGPAPTAVLHKPVASDELLAQLEELLG
ncbi:response regulator [Persicimonas caeni]|uniref:histidine kinase n=1 Tax=Persicimonas caeni TaxID=2292766 RepID=A0A4Y6PTL1_PERCE|nr:ATP-binding protein [Persicimonas caeni]QDG51469.1 response regulator [Persicimonas caeni]QED32690.1 response regulator [Persicimonas caeni]